jgi:translation elongation factor EF-1beta
MSAAAVATIIVGVIGAATSITGSAISSSQQKDAIKKAGSEAKRIQDLARSDMLRQERENREAAKQQLGLQKQAFGLQALQLGSQQRQFRETMDTQKEQFREVQNKQSVMTALKTIGDAANQNANFKNHLLSRARY